MNINKIKNDILTERCAGVLLHITSLPSATGAGDLGGARAFIDFAASVGLRVWQVLPLGPTHDDLSPYLCTSSFAGNPNLIDLEYLKKQGWLLSDCYLTIFDSWRQYREACLTSSAMVFKREASQRWRQKYQRFVTQHAGWLDDFALFTALRDDAHGCSWLLWPPEIKHRHAQALLDAQSVLADAIDRVKFEQFIFYTQWLEIRQYANEKGVLLFGDMPLFVAHDSADVWVNMRYFKVDGTGEAQVVAGVPPDYFSEDGQKWGNPVFNWAQLEASKFDWWVRRIQSQLELYNLLRIDHFRGLEACWEIPADSKTAKAGSWQKTPGKALLQTLYDKLGSLPLIAEDLGYITEEVKQLREQFDLPGMNVMQFAFDGSADNPYLVQNHIENSVVYTGTHDNNTTLGWYESLTEDMQARVNAAVNRPHLRMPWSLIEYTLSSPAQLVMLPMQDILALGPAHRLNTPGTISGNWLWQFSWQQVEPNLAQRLHALLNKYSRLKKV